MKSEKDFWKFSAMDDEANLILRRLANSREIDIARVRAEEADLERFF